MNRTATEAEQILAPGRARRAPERSVVARPARARLLARAEAWVPWLVALVPFVLLATLPRIPGPGIEADDYGQYLMHAQALATGHAYTDILYIHSRLNPWVGPAAAPPGLPLLLAPVLGLLGLAAVPWFMLAIALLMLGLIGRYFLEHDERSLALGTMALCGLPPTILFVSMQPLTDLPFAAAVWGMAILADREGRPSNGRLLALTALGAFAIALRPVGIVLLPTLLLLAWLRRRAGGWRLTIPVLAWTLAGALAAAVLDMRRVLLVRLRLSGMLGMLGPHSLVHKARWYGAVFLDAQLDPLPRGWPADIYHVLASVLVLIGAIAWLRRRPGSFLTLLAFAYGAMLLVLPLSDGRYLWPLVPLLVFLLLKGINVVAARFLLPVAAARLAAVAVLLLAVGGAVNVLRHPRPVALSQTPKGQELFSFLRQTSAEEPMRVAFAKPRMLAWELGIPAMGPIGRNPAASLAELCRQRITHLIVSDKGPDGFMQHLATSRPESFASVFSNGKYSVYRVIESCPASATQGSAAGARTGTER